MTVRRARPLGRFALSTGGLGVVDAVAAVRHAEALGFEAALVSEAALDADAFVVSAAALAATSLIRVGPGVANVVDRHPVTLARAAASLDQLARGRVLLGLGRGASAHAHALGLAPPPTGALEDALRICRALLGGDGVEHHGGHWSAHLGTPPWAAARSRVSLQLAAVGPRTLRLAGALADTVLLNYAMGPEYVRWAVKHVREAAESAGRDPEQVDTAGYVLVARTDQEDAERQLDMVRRTVALMHAIPGEGALLSAPSRGGGGIPAWDDAARYAAVGDEGACLSRLDEYRAAGLRCIVLMPTGMHALYGPPG